MSISFPSLNSFLICFTENKFLSEPVIQSLIIGISLLIILCIILIVQTIRQKKQVKLIEIVKKKFINQTVRLDGHKFINCQFDTCTIEYAGGDFVIDNSDIGENCRMYFMTKESYATALLLYNFAFLKNTEKQLYILDKYGRVFKKPEIINNRI